MIECPSEIQDDNLLYSDLDPEVQEVVRLLRGHRVLEPGLSY